MNTLKPNRNNKTIFFVVIIYNLIGLISLFGLYPKDPFYWDWNVAILLFTFPITIISFGYRFMMAEPIFPIFIIQFIMLIISLLIVKKICKSRTN